MEKVLELRENEEKNIMKDYGVLQKKLDEEEKKLQEILAELEELKNNNKTFDIQGLKQYNLYREILEHRIEVQRNIINISREELEAMRSKLIEAQKDRKIMEKVKENDYDRYLEDLRITEVRELDEMAVLRFGSKRII